ncbi:MAG: Uma2 family endonuclease [Rhodocyclaceae bacterium]|nr:Uma2 family endonuclease [Rhodocyclaceae bacterium]
MALPQLKMTLDDFVDWENEQPERHIFYRGEIFAMNDGEVSAMAGVRKAHAHVTLNLGAALNSPLRGTPCKPFITDVKLRIDAAETMFYPDIMVGCDPRDKKTPLHLAHPKLIIEVLSESTAAFDRGLKFITCRRIDTLEEYALVDIDHRCVEVFRRNSDNQWVLHEFSGEESVEFASVGLTLSAELLYENVDIEE